MEQEISPDAVRSELETVLSSRRFESSPRLSAFLRYVVQRTLAGESEGLKEYAIATEVFERSESFDPRTDTLVRVQARRLRQRLTEHYADPDRQSEIVIDLPKGGYVPKFRRASSWLSVMTATEPSREISE